MTDHRTEDLPETKAIDPSDQCFHGPRALLVCGFSTEDRAIFKNLLDRIGLGALTLIWAGAGDSERMLNELFLVSEYSGEDKNNSLPRAVIAAGIEVHELHRLMGEWRQSGMKPLLWAVLTPTSGNWTLRQLLKTLAEEAKAMAAKKDKKQK